MTSEAPGLIAFHRPARVFPIPPGEGPITIAAPPTVPGSHSGSILQIFLPLAGSASMIGFSFIYRNSTFRLIAIAVAALMVTASLGMYLGNRRRIKKQRRRNAERYRAYLADKEQELADAARGQADSLAWVYPGIDGAWSLVNEGLRVWERRYSDHDFMHVRLGTGTVSLARPVQLDISSDPLVEYEPDLLGEARTMYEEHEALDAAPVVIPTRDLGAVAIVGDPEFSRPLMRSVIATLAALQAPDDMKLIGSFAPEDLEEWAWMKWLPHARDSAEAADQARHSVALATDAADFEVLLSRLVRPRIEHLERLRSEKRADTVRFQHVLVVTDATRDRDVLGLTLFEEMLRRAPDIGITPFVLVASGEHVPSDARARVEIAPGGWLRYVETAVAGRREEGVRADGAGTDICEAIARALAPLRLRGRDDRARRVDSEGLFDLLHLGSPADIQVSDGRTSVEDLLRAPIGVCEDGTPLVFDLKESAEGGMGPHGLLVGATGSGKSELLRTLVTGLAVEHNADELAFVLVDYKGGATFAQLDAIPHCAGMITNIERDLTLVDRMHEALFGELERRQRVLREAGNFDSVREYQLHRRAHPEKGSPALPSLLVIVDEFGELLANKPDFIDLFVSIGRTGRSLGVHLLLATQRLETGRLRGLESHLRYRICLRSFSAEESVAVLGTRDAYDLPPLPGLGFLSVDGSLVQFKAALSTRPYRERRDLEELRPRGEVRNFDVGMVAGPDEPNTTSITFRPRHHESELEVAVARLKEIGAGDGVRRVWLPPLPQVLTLDQVVDPDKEDDRAPTDMGWLEVVIGLRDRPRQQQQLPMSLSFTGRTGHWAIVGAPRSGKSTVLQTMVSSLALNHSPRDVQLYVFDLGGGALHPLRSLPHVGGVYGRADRAGIERALREVRALIERRADTFRRLHVADMADFHARRHGGEIDDDWGEVFLIIDNWAAVAQEFEEVHNTLAEMVGMSLHYGIHLVITSNRWMDIRMNVRDNIGGRMELRLNDPLDSELDRNLAKSLPDVPGRGLTREGEHFQTALPRIDGNADISGLASSFAHLADHVEGRWGEEARAPEIKMLPDIVRPSDVADRPRDGILLGIEEFRLDPVGVDLFGGSPHLLVYGDGATGKTNLLRGVVDEIASRSDPSQVKIAVVDYRRSLADAVRGVPNVVAFAYTSEAATTLAKEVVSEMERRLPSGQNALGAPVEDVHSWSGPHVVVVVDDYDMVSTARSNPLAPLADVIAQGADVGLHLVLARRVAGTARNSFEPLYQRVVEIGSAAVILSGDPREGPLVAGVKAQPLPPGRAQLVVDRRVSLIQTLLRDGEKAR